MHNMGFMVLDFLYYDNANNNSDGGIISIIIINNMFKYTVSPASLHVSGKSQYLEQIQCFLR